MSEVENEMKCSEIKCNEMTISEKVRSMFRNITVEPMKIFYMLPAYFANLATQNLNLEKACRVNLNYSNEVCSALSLRQTGGFEIEESNVQKLVANMSVWTMPLRSFIPPLLIMFLGSWSDRNKRRKPLMLIPIVGEFISCVGLLICVFYFFELPMEVAGFVESFFPALTGGWTTFYMALYSYMADITTVETRTVRIGILSVCGDVAVPLGTALSGIALKVIGFYGIYSLSAWFYLFSFTYGILRIKESSLKYDIDRKYNIDKHEDSHMKEEFSVSQLLKDCFDLKHVKDIFSVVFKKTANNRRQKIILIIVTDMIVSSVYQGEMGLMYLFMRYRFNWDEVKFSIYSTYSVIVLIIGYEFQDLLESIYTSVVCTGASLSMGVFSHLLKFDDAVIGGLSCASKIASSLVFAFAQQEWQVYLVPLVDLLGGSSYIAVRVITSKLVPTEELGQLNSVYGACEALIPLLYGPLYALVYARTMDTMPGAFFIMSAALTMLALFIFCWIYMQNIQLRLETDTIPSRRPSVGEEVEEPPTPKDRTVPTPLVIVPLDNANHKPKPEGNEGGQLNLGFEENTL